MEFFKLVFFIYVAGLFIIPILIGLDKGKRVMPEFNDDFEKGLMVFLWPVTLTGALVWWAFQVLLEIFNKLSEVGDWLGRKKLTPPWGGVKIKVNEHYSRDSSLISEEEKELRNELDLVQRRFRSARAENTGLIMQIERYRERVIELEAELKKKTMVPVFTKQSKRKMLLLEENNND